MVPHAVKRPLTSLRTLLPQSRIPSSRTPPPAAQSSPQWMRTLHPCSQGTLKATATEYLLFLVPFSMLSVCQDHYCPASVAWWDRVTDGTGWMTGATLTFWDGTGWRTGSSFTFAYTLFDGTGLLIRSAFTLWEGTERMTGVALKLWYGTGWMTGSVSTYVGWRWINDRVSIQMVRWDWMKDRVSAHIVGWQYRALN